MADLEQTLFQPLCQPHLTWLQDLYVYLVDNKVGFCTKLWFKLRQLVLVESKGDFRSTVHLYAVMLLPF